MCAGSYDATWGTDSLAELLCFLSDANGKLGAADDEGFTFAPVTG
jgi:hypothetical protein